jgi:uncharacterized protein YjbI with pentapeptide repeats
VRRWFSFSFRSEQADVEAATKTEEAQPLEGDGDLVSAAEMPPLPDALAEVFADEPPPNAEAPSSEIATVNQDAGTQEPTIADTLDELFPNERGFDVRAGGEGRAGVEILRGWEPLPGDLARALTTEGSFISAAELPSAAHILAELFPSEQEPTADTDTATERTEIERANDTGGSVDEPGPAQGSASREADVAEQEATGQFHTPEVPQRDSPSTPAGPVKQSSRPPYRDWAFEEKLASHREWVESHGVTGTKADFAGADLEGVELIGVNFRFVDFHDANLKAADLLLADLRDACLVRADLQDACLVGANLEGANLEDASLESAMGLVPRQVAGANLRDASLPPSFLEFAAAADFERASQGAARFIAAMLSASAVCWLILWRTKDIQLLADSAVIPFLHSRTAATALPTVESYLILPVALFLIYLVVLFHLQRVWDAVLELPAIFPNGRALGDRGRGIVLGLLRAHFRWIEQDASSTRSIEKGICLFLAYWTVPVTLLLFWARYLTRQDVRGTILHAGLTVAATGIAVHATTRTGRPLERWILEPKKWIQRLLSRIRAINPAAVAAGLGAVLLFLSVGTIAGVPHDRSRAPQYGAANIRRWAPNALWSIGFDPYADLTEASISTRPANWTGTDDQIVAVSGPRLNGAKFRYAQAYGAFLANAHLWRADFEGAFLSDADLRGADLGQSSFRFALMDGARMNRANLDGATLNEADLRRADLRDANLSHAWLLRAILVDAQLEGASLYGARLTQATLTRANLGKADLRESYLDGAQLEHADFRGAYLWSARLPGADLRGAQMANAILIDTYLRDADLRWAQFAGTVLDGANLTGANLDGADLRGALGLSAHQVCSTKSHAGTLFDDALEGQVQAQCPTAQERAAAELAP